VDGSLGAVGNRLDAVRGGRAGSGAAWVQEFGQFIDRESSFSDPGYRGSGFGMAFGMDRPLGPFYAIGLNVSGASSEIEQPYGSDTPLSVASAQLGGYAAANVGSLLLDLYAGAGADFFESERLVTVGSAVRQTTGEWKAHHATATARLAYDINMQRLFARPAVSVDYFRMDEESYSEDGVGAGSTIALRLDERSSEMLATTASLTLGAQFGSMDRTWWSPRVRVGYRNESMGGPQLTTARYLAGGDPFTLRADDLPSNGALVGFSFAAGSRWSSFALDYDADVREGFVRHGVRVAFRFIF
jgi:outer membrane autotransporter protein